MCLVQHGTEGHAGMGFEHLKCSTDRLELRLSNRTKVSPALWQILLEVAINYHNEGLSTEASLTNRK